MINFPEAYLQQMQDLLIEDYPAFAASCKHPTISGLRVNTMKISITDF
jgi:hypothetical protein